MDILRRDIVYQTIDQIELRLHLFEQRDRDRRILVPAIVFFFGGGWVGGTPEQFFPHCQYLASRGMVAISAEYRVKDRHGVTPQECVLDGKSAMRWVRAHAAELGIDPQRIAAGGGSAGGHVALCTAMIQVDGETQAAASAMPDALVLFNPVADTTEGQISVRFPGGQAQALSPAHHVCPGLPPAIIFHGTADTTVPFAQVERFCERMVQAGNICRLVAFEGKGHAFFNYGRDDNQPYRETIVAADRFLVSLGYLRGPLPVLEEHG
jgi:acetyl esterase